MRNVSAAVLVYDITNRKSFNEIDRWYNGEWWEFMQFQMTKNGFKIQIWPLTGHIHQNKPKTELLASILTIGPKNSDPKDNLGTKLAITGFLTFGPKKTMNVN